MSKDEKKGLLSSHFSDRLFFTNLSRCKQRDEADNKILDIKYIRNIN